MKFTIVAVGFLIILSAQLGSAGAIDETQNLNKLLNNQVIVSRQIMCVLDKTPCDKLGTQLKQQAANAQKLVSFLQTRYPDVWAMLVRKYKGAPS
uniref:Chemosensory protein 2 n=1 Tax=Propsilocerus akamusi TaxID=903466 RepID=A0A7D0P9M9_9DIPT|nr:chemosensory protein 2 [Propsilocerus akamusi]